MIDNLKEHHEGIVGTLIGIFTFFLSLLIKFEPELQAATMLGSLILVLYNIRLVRIRIRKAEDK